MFISYENTKDIPVRNAFEAGRQKYKNTRMKQLKQKINKLGWIAILVAVFGFLPAGAFASEITSANVIKYVNEAREKEGVKELLVSEKLNEVATRKINDMVENKYFAHTSPSGLSPWHWFEKSGYDYKYAGENLAINFTTAETQQAAWMNSPTHRKNILNINYKEIGVAVAVGEINGHMGIIAVQEFGTLTHPGAMGSDSNNFSNAKDKTIPDDTKFVPTVLSVGNSNTNQEILKNFGEKITEQKNNWLTKYDAWTFFWLAMFVSLALPIIIAQVVFVGKVLGLPWFKSLLIKKYQSICVNDPREYLKELKLNNKRNYNPENIKILTT